MFNKKQKRIDALTKQLAETENSLQDLINLIPVEQMSRYGDVWIPGQTTLDFIKNLKKDVIK